MNHSKKLRLIREKLGFSQEALGKRINHTGAHISRLENGKSAISDAILQSYITAFGVDPEWIKSELDSEEVRFVEQKIEGFDTLAGRVRNLRQEMEMSQNKFAEFTGVQQADINRVEAGKGTLGPQSLKRIAESCHVGMEWLLYGDNSKKLYPVDDKMIAYLWENELLRKKIYQSMVEDAGKK